MSSIAPVTPTAKVAKTKGIDYLPLFAQPGSPHSGSLELTPPIEPFTDEEMEKFRHRYEEGYDLDIDDRYNEWLGMYHGKPAQSTLASLGHSFVGLDLSQDQDDSTGICTSTPPQSLPHSEPLPPPQPAKFKTINF